MFYFVQVIGNVCMRRSVWNVPFVSVLYILRFVIKWHDYTKPHTHAVHRCQFPQGPTIPGIEKEE